jgi:hypothetical protein
MTGFIATITGGGIVNNLTWTPTTSLALKTQYIFTQGWSISGTSFASVNLIGIEWIQDTTYWIPRVTLSGNGSGVIFTLYYYYQ